MSLWKREKYTQSAVVHSVYGRSFSFPRCRVLFSNTYTPGAVYTCLSSATLKSEPTLKPHSVADVSPLCTQLQYTLKVKIVVYSHWKYKTTSNALVYTQTTFINFNSNNNVHSERFTHLYSDTIMYSKVINTNSANALRCTLITHPNLSNVLFCSHHINKLWNRIVDTWTGYSIHL